MAQELPNVSPVDGLDYTHPSSGEVFGTIRLDDTPRHLPIAGNYLAFADDSCGNAFAISPDSRIWFWDHETDELTCLADSWDQFVAGCHEPELTELPPHEVKSVWIDPEFAKQHGIDVPPDGWKKRP